MDLIKREDAIKAEADRVYKVLHSEGCKETYEECLADAEKTFKDIPSAEKQGEWICEMTKSQDQARDRWVIERVVLYCSECNGEAVKMTKFCPNCGARMEGVDDE